MTPAIVLVPGMSSAGSVVYAPLIEELRKTNFEHLYPVHLPSIDFIATKALLKPNALHADIQAIRATVQEALRVQAKDVVVVAHSYGGTPTLYACEGLWKGERSDGTPGVLKVALISSSLTLPGSSVAGDRMEYGKTHGGIDDDGADVQMVGEELGLFPNSSLASGYFSDMAEEERKKWGDTLRPSALGNVMSSTPPTDAKMWKLSYLITAEVDLAMPEGFQKLLIEKAQDAGAEVTVEEIKSGHFVQITHAREVAAWIGALCK